MTEMQFSFRVNGRPVHLSCAEATQLGLVLRNELGLRGTRMGCEQGSCGACMVVVDGRAVQSCDMAVSLVEDKDILTIDGLLASDPPHPLVNEILNQEAGQCGFCLAGIIMAAYPLFAHQSGCDALTKALEGNFCRCGAHSRILDALETALDEALQ